MKHTLSRRALGDFEVIESLYPANLKQPRHTHTLASFSVVLSGTYNESFGGQPLLRLPGTIVVHPPNESHAVAYNRESVRIISVRLSSEQQKHFQTRTTAFTARASKRSASIAWLGRRLFYEFKHPDVGSSLALEGLIYELLGEVARESSARKKSPAWLAEAEDFLHDNFCANPSFAEIAGVVGVHGAHLARVFRQKHGCTIGEYVRRLRVQFAASQMVFTKASLTEIANAAGFADHSHLTKTFKVYFGVSPSEYRRNNRR